MSPRAEAAGVLAQVIGRGRSLDAALPAEAAGTVRALCFGTLRWLPRLRFMVDRLLHKPPRRRDADIYGLMLLACFELEDGQTPAYAVVDGACAAARERGKPGLVKLVNGVLRRFQRESAALHRAVEADPVACSAHPGWLLDALQADWPGDWRAIVAANNAKAPLWLRVNRRRSSVADYRRRLKEAGLKAAPEAPEPEAICLETPVNVLDLPGFDDGLVSVQDAGAQRAARLLAPAAGHRVLDACAAPGGKTAHLLERSPELAGLVAVDRSDKRLQHLRANLSRLGLDATVIRGDATAPGAWWDGKRFDRILLDAPCSATGVIRRHPDIKRLRRGADIEALAATQSTMLETLWPLLAPGGRLVYATCSVLRAENTAVVGDFLQEHPEAGAGAAPARQNGMVGQQTLPGEQAMDGFYYAVLDKTG